MNAYAVIHAGWDTFRRSQEIPFPPTGGGTVLRAQSRLFYLVAPYACGHEDPAEADLGAIEKAAAELAALTGGEGQAAA